MRLIRNQMLLVSAALALVALPGLVSCADSPEDEGSYEGQTLESVRGMVLEVEAESLISLRTLEVGDESGTVWRFEGRGKVLPGFTPSHLNEHKLLGQSVLVTFYREDETLIILSISD